MTLAMRTTAVLRAPGMVWVAVVFVVLLGLTLSAWYTTRTAIEATTRARFDLTTSQILAAISDRLEQYEQVLWGGVGLFAASDAITRREWRSYVDRLRIQDRLPGIQGFGFALRVPAEELSRHVREIRSQGFPRYAVRPGGSRPEYHPIIYLEPFDWRNQRAFGYDMFSEPIRQAAMAQARDSGQATMSGKVILVQETETDVQNGFLIYVPVYRNGIEVDSVEARRSALMGYVYSPFRARDMILGVLQRQPTDIGMEIYDGPTIDESALLYRSAVLPPGGAAASSAKLVNVVTRETVARSWTVRFTALPSYRSVERQRPPIILAAGLVISVLASAVAGSFVLNRARALETNLKLSADMARRREMEEQLRQSEEKFRLLFAKNPHPMWTYDPVSLRFIEVNDTAVAKYGYLPTEFQAMRILDLRPPEDVPALMKVLAKGASRFGTFSEVRHRLKGGQVIDVEIVSHPIELFGRSVILVAANDISKRKKAEAALQISEARFRTIMDHAPLMVSLKDLDGRYRFANRRFLERHGLTEDAVIGRTVTEILPEARAVRETTGDNDTLLRGTPVQYEDTVSLGGQPQTTLYIHFPIRHVDEKPEAVATIAADVSDLRSMEEQLRQAQKMEAIGHLTGGIAHDFNNLLTVILGNAELVSERVEADRISADMLATLVAAAERAAELTSRLLAFARRQTLQPVRTDLNKLVRGMESLLRRTLGETVEVHTGLREALWPAVVDPVQVENVLLNLAVNSRDAMPEGGRLVLETDNVALDDEVAASFRFEVPTGDYVMLAVTDTGAGMSADVLERAVEPFFTTKEVGKGSGLGLSMVYGFVKQSGGFLKIYSEVGHGTSVKIYLPRATSGAAPTAGPVTEAETLPRGDETILVVEDDQLVRDFVVGRLKSLGYEIIPAPDGPAALSILQSGQPIDLLFTDVVLPKGMSGPQLVDHVRRLHPDMKVLFTSGYTEAVIAHQGELDPQIGLLQKPYRLAALARKIREVLDGSDRR